MAVVARHYLSEEAFNAKMDALINAVNHDRGGAYCIVHAVSGDDGYEITESFADIYAAYQKGQILAVNESVNAATYFPIGVAGTDPITFGYNIEGTTCVLSIDVTGEAVSFAEST